MKNVLVTGGAGFIGSNFVRYLLEERPDVRIVTLDALTYAGSLANLSSLPAGDRHTFIQGDICDQRLVADILRSHSIDTIVNLAAETHVDRSLLSADPFVQSNVKGTVSLLESSRQVWLTAGSWEPEGCRFHHVSTDEVYGSLGPADPPSSERALYAPTSPYAASKAAADHFVRAYVHAYQLPATISNCSNNYGPYQYPEKLIPLVLLNALEGKPLPIYGDGRQVRDWLFVDDHIRALILILESGVIGQTYNISTGVELTNLQVVRAICGQLDEMNPHSAHAPHETLIQFVQDRPGHDRRYALDASKISSELAWQPQHSFEDGLRATIGWYLNNATWVEAIRARPEYAEWLKQNYSTRGVEL